MPLSRESLHRLASRSAVEINLAEIVRIGGHCENVERKDASPANRVPTGELFDGRLYGISGTCFTGYSRFKPTGWKRNVAACSMKDFYFEKLNISLPSRLALSLETFWQSIAQCRLRKRVVLSRFTFPFDVTLKAALAYLESDFSGVSV